MELNAVVQICRFFKPNTGPRFGAVVDTQVFDLSAAEQPAFASFNAWLQLVAEQGLNQSTQQLKALIGQAKPVYKWVELERRPDPAYPHLLPPLDNQEVWAAGVTYYRSRQAREDESNQIGVYDKVYDAERPELFFKATPHRVVGSHDFIRVRSDSTWNVPEPELTLVLSPDLQVVGYTVGNDVSSRDIEGENPLYLPQAKIYAQCCALGPAITLAPDVQSTNFSVEMTIRRDGHVVFQDGTDTSQMKRTVAELVSYLGRDNDFPNGAFLMTGTGLVPPDEYSLQDGDVVEISIEGIGRLRNTVTGMIQSSTPAIS